MNTPISLLAPRNMFDPEGARIAISIGEEITVISVDTGRLSTNLVLRMAELQALHAQIGAALAKEAVA